MSEVIFFRSNDRNKVAYPYSSDCEINFVNIECQKIQVKNVVMLNSYYNITSNFNSFTFDASPITIPVGYYSGSALATKIQSLISDMTVTYDYSTFKFTFTKITSSHDFVVDELLAKVLGTTTSFTVSTSYEGDIAQLQGTAYYMIEIENLNRKIYGTTRSNRFVVPNDENIGEIIFYDMELLNVEFIVPGGNLSKLRVKIYDDEGNLIQSKIEWFFECIAV